MRKDERFIVTYRIQAVHMKKQKAIAWAVQVGTNHEFPYEFITTDSYIKENNFTGRLESLEPMGQGSPYIPMLALCHAVIDVSRYYVARISYHVDTTALEATQFLNVVFGNSSYKLSYLGGRCRVMSNSLRCVYGTVQLWFHKDILDLETRHDL